MTPTVNIALDKSYKIKKGEHAGKYHAKIWVTFHLWRNGKRAWDQQPYKTNCFCTVEEFNAMMDPDPKTRTRLESLKQIRRKLDAEKQRAEDYIKNYNIVDQRKFELYYLSTNKPESLVGQFELKITELENPKRGPKKISSAENYRTALRSFQDFFGTPDVTFQMCNAEALQDYEDWYIEQPRGENSKQKKSLASVGFNMRCLRHIFKRAIRAGIIPQSLYPFGTGEDQYIIPEGEGDDSTDFFETHHKDLFLKHSFSYYECEKCKRRVFDKRVDDECPFCKGTLYQIPHDYFNELHDYAVFIYFCNGMNPADIFRLRKSQRNMDHFAITNREKIKAKKKKKMKTYRIPIHSRMNDIISRRGRKLIGVDDYFIFPVLNDQMTYDEQYKAIRKVCRDIIRMLQRFAVDVKLGFIPDIYTIRHTFSKDYIESGASTEELQEALIHQAVSTTETYKHRLNFDRKKKLSEGLG